MASAMMLLSIGILACVLPIGLAADASDSSSNRGRFESLEQAEEYIMKKWDEISSDPDELEDVLKLVKYEHMEKICIDGVSVAMKHEIAKLKYPDDCRFDTLIELVDRMKDCGPTDKALDHIDSFAAKCVGATERIVNGAFDKRYMERFSEYESGHSLNWRDWYEGRFGDSCRQIKYISSLISEIRNENQLKVSLSTMIKPYQELCESEKGIKVLKRSARQADERHVD